MVHIWYRDFRKYRKAKRKLCIGGPGMVLSLFFTPVLFMF